MDPSSIRLEGDEDSRRWNNSKKWGMTIVISLMGFIAPLGSSIVVPGGMFIDRSFRLNSRTLSVVPVSVYVLGQGVGPFILAPISELKGRQPVYVIAAFLFILFNIGTTVSENFVALNVLRFFAGAAGSAGPSLGSGSIGDLFEPRERGRAQSLYGLGPLLGPVLGNVIGGFIAQSDKDWRWLLGTLTILSAAVFVIVVAFLRETYAPVLLRKKREKIVREREEREARIERERIASDPVLAAAKASEPRPSLGQRIKARARALLPNKEAREKIKVAQTRPFRLLFTNPICAIFSTYLGFCYGIVFLFLTQHPLLFQRREAPDSPSPMKLPTYNWTLGRAGLSYFGLGLGFLCSALINALLQDVIYKRLVASDGRVGWFLFKSKQEITSLMEERERKKTAEAGHEMDLEKPSNQAVSSTCPPKPPPPPPPSSASSPPPPPANTGPTNPTPKKGRPEYRLPLCLLGMMIMPAGLFCFGWSAETKSHWMLPLLGSFLTGMGTILCFQTILVYLVDAFVPYSASATACAVLVRSILAAAFPLFAEELYEDLGYGWGSSLIAFIALAGIPVPIILFRYGERLRNRYRFVC
ncbi:MFS general substrate transporter [Violaceomyces palustris]|uniref:MFS general substrate transporter n=1 Tax=Violaceomyces palustris TaxID=1673888 RepID=A0ACD0NSP6_9BASI|nr:MFS general substrate transporter [Violaceomyces palustris]